VSKQMGDYDGLCARTETRLDRLRSDVVSPGVNVGENRNGALVQDWRERSHVGDGTRDDFIPGVGVDCGYREVNRRRSRRTRIGMLYSKGLSEALLETPDKLSFRTREGAALNRASQQLDLLAAKRSPGGFLVRGQ